MTIDRIIRIESKGRITRDTHPQFYEKYGTGIIGNEWIMYTKLQNGTTGIMPRCELNNYYFKMNAVCGKTGKELYMKKVLYNG